MNNLLASCEETKEEVIGVVKGTVPEWLNVNMLRLGPAKWDLDQDFSLNHWLDGCAMLCRFSFDKGRVVYDSRYLRSNAYNKMSKVGRPVFTEFGSRAYPDPCKNVFSRFFSQIVPSDLTDNGCVGIYKLSDEYYAASETCNILKVSAKTLEVVKKVSLDKIVGVNLASSHVQYIEGEPYAYNMSSSFITGLKYHLLKIPLFDKGNNNNETAAAAAAKVEGTSELEEDTSLLNGTTIIATLSSSWKTCIAYYHSYGLTPNYVVFIELPLLVNGFKLATCTPKGKPLKDCFEWFGNERSRFYVICKQTGAIVTKAYAKAFFFFHTINSFEDEGHVVMDMIAYDDSSIIDQWNLEEMRNDRYISTNKSKPTRFVIPLGVPKTCEVDVNLVKLDYTQATAKMCEGELLLEPDLIGPPGFELPTINYKGFNGRKYRYCYGSGVFEKGNFANSVSLFGCYNFVNKTNFLFVVVVIL